MSIFSAANVPIIGQRAQQAVPVKESERRKAVKAAPGATRGQDEVELEIQNSSSDGAVRSLKDNTDQETADDREQQDHYQAPAAPPGAKPKRPPLDIQG